MIKLLKKISCVALFLSTNTMTAQAADLYEAYQDALANDPTFQQAVAQQKSDNELLPIAYSALLPGVALTGTAGVNHTYDSGSQTRYQPGGNATNRSYDLQLMATQPLFDMGIFAGLSQAKLSVKAAAANYAAAVQALMIRVASAYFDVLLAQDNMRYAESKKNFLEQNLQQAQEKYQVGLNTVTDVNLAQASYSAAVAALIAAENTLANKRENLRAITNREYSQFAALKNDFPLVTPAPANIDLWVDAATKTNWSIKAADLNAEAAHENINVQRSGHYPSVALQAGYEDAYGYNTIIGNSKRFTPQAAVSVTVPLFQGGRIVAQTRQAVADYEIADQQKELVLRNTINSTRSSYLSVLAGIAQIKADKTAITASESALEGMEAGYKLGTQTMIDVLSAQDDLFNNQTTYAQDRYNYLLTTLQLKQASGSLSANDLAAVNKWLEQPVGKKA